MSKKTNRRQALKTGLALLTAAGTMAASAPARAQSAKSSPSSVGYQTKPSNGQQCSGCVQFIKPNDCKLVSGDISPTGWCELYSPAS